MAKNLLIPVLCLFVNLVFNPNFAYADNFLIDDSANEPASSHERSPANYSLENNEEPRPFGQASIDLGLILGISTGHETSFTFGATGGYFVLNGLEPGLQIEVTVSSANPTVTSLLPFLRWIIWRSYPVSPYLKIQGGRWFISDYPDVSTLGGGGGLVFFFSSQAGLQVEGMVYRLFPDTACPNDSCLTSNFGLSLGFFFRPF